MTQTGLLPATRIDLFLHDDRLMPIARQLAADWRMGRIRLDVQQGGVAAAVGRYRQSASPPLVVVELPPDPALIDAVIEQLAEHCAEGTRAIILGHVNDVMLYRRLIAEGVSDYLVGDLGCDDFLAAFARALTSDTPVGQGRLIAVTGAKGGVGTTSIAQALAVMAAGQGIDCLLVDGCCGLGTSGIAFGAESKRSCEEIFATLQQGDGLADILRRVCWDISPGLRLIPGGRGQGPDFIDAGLMEDWLQQLRSQSALVVIDLPGAHHPLTRHLVAGADQMVLVTAPMLASMRLARLGLEQIQARRGAASPFHLVVNGAGCFAGHEVPEPALVQAFGTEAKGKLLMVPFVPGVFAAAETDGKGLAPGKQRDRVFQALQPILGDIGRAAPTADPVQSVLKNLKSMLDRKAS